MNCVSEILYKINHKGRQAGVVFLATDWFLSDLDLAEGVIAWRFYEDISINLWYYLKQYRK